MFQKGLTSRHSKNMFSTYLLYIYPGTGSLVVQVIVAGFAAFFVFFKNSFRRIFYRNKKEAQKKDNKSSD